MTRFVRAALLVTLVVLPLAACSNGNFDPTDLFDGDIFNTKKKVAGERQPVFPEGTPGVPNGVPPELVRGYQAPPEPPADPVLQAGAPREDAAPKPKAKPKPKPKVAAQPAPPQGRPTSVTVRPDAQPPRQAPGGGPGGVQWPDPPAPR